jgi:hypothetical protein
MSKTLTLKKWQPIKSAPEGERILVYNKTVGQYITRREGKLFPMLGWDGAAGIWYPEPTHWKPLDADP